MDQFSLLSDRTAASPLALATLAESTFAIKDEPDRSRKQRFSFGYKR